MTHRITLVSGATSASGHAVCARLVQLGHPVVAVSRDSDRLARLQASVPDVSVERCDMADAGEVGALAERLTAESVVVSSLVHLVGGWRGGGGIAGQSDEDWEFLVTSLDALRIASRQFIGEIAGGTGRLISVSSPMASAPRAGSANYAAVKAATEAWTFAVADELTSTDAAASVIVAKTLGGHEHQLADRVAELFAAEAAAVNGRRFALADPIF
ncbi:SDR family NAD(P)-dependent oxidoreductase [Okibacterium endophyticum]